MVKAEAADAATVVVTLSGKQARDTILTVAGLPIFSKAFYTANDFLAGDADAAARLRALQGRAAERRALHRVRARRRLLGQGPAGQRRPQQFRRDPHRLLHASGRRPSRPSRRARSPSARSSPRSPGRQDYNFPAIAAGKVVKTLLPGREAPVVPGLVHQHPARQVRDPRTRQAIGLAFDFEWTNRNLFFDSYTRLELLLREVRLRGASGMPTPEELALLEPFRAELPPEVFGEAYVPPASDGSGRDRKLLRQAVRAARRGRLDPDRQHG